ncbi:hypothetical protein KC19_10G002000 [Ceratodon purpureus]|uniref:Peroxisomal nicotinamide adenine dinucleotide carrier n=1 Tax=Ceratodon purpureus TaxID=3225 RepID=A0A8T0GHJ1_CERPU|nr:hypothetical protein KC19_10G002000 [Ceratodon purpureus]
MSDAVVNGLAGAGGGIVSLVLTYPLLVVNTRQQTERKAKANNGELDVDAVLSSNASSKLTVPTGTVQEIFKVIRTEGWGGLYRGFMPSLLGTAFLQGAYYYFYQLLRNEAEARAQKSKKLGYADASVGMLTSLVIATVAGCANVLLTNPIWVIVTRMQTQAQAQKRSEMAKNNKNKTSSGYFVSPSVDLATASNLSNSSPSTAGQGTLDTVKDLYNEAGVRGFWKGVLPSLIMVCNPAVQFMLYEITSRGVKHVSASEVFLLGAIAKLGATVVTYPLLVVKSRLQAKQEIGDKYLQYSGTLDAIVEMLRFEGVTGFYKGMSTKIVQSVMAAAILFMIKEELVKAARALITKQVKIPKMAKLKAAST